MKTTLQWNNRAPFFYTVLFAVFFLAQIMALFALLILSIPLAAERITYPLPYLLPLATIMVLALGLLIINGFTLTLQAFHEVQKHSRSAQYKFWLAFWEEVRFGDKTLPSGPLPPEGVTALLDLKESLGGEEARELLDIARYYEIDAQLMRQLALGRRTARLHALEALAKLKSPLAMLLLVKTADSSHPSLRYGALRALARTIVTLPDETYRERMAMSLFYALSDAALPFKASEEVLMLLDKSALGPVREILRTSVTEEFQQLALEVAGRLDLNEVQDDIAKFVSDPNPELRAAALRAFSRLGTLPPDARALLILAQHDEEDFVRVQATRVAPLLPQPSATRALWAALGDHSWWVRSAAAQALADMDGMGSAYLTEAAAHHPDRYGRDAAKQVLYNYRSRMAPLTQPSERQVHV